MLIFQAGWEIGTRTPINGTRTRCPTIRRSPRFKWFTLIDYLKKCRITNITMPKEILEYLNTQRVGVIALEMLDGSPHGATVHFAHSENPFVFYFETSREYKKAEALLNRKNSRATLVIGTNEIDMKTLQLDGIVELIDISTPEIQSVYLGKFTEKREKSKEPKVIFFKFTPTWWRFTDWKTPNGKLILCSTDQSKL